jgi:hypothetical protein
MRMRGAIPLFLQYVFMAWSLVKHRGKLSAGTWFFSSPLWGISKEAPCLEVKVTTHRHLEPKTRSPGVLGLRHIYGFMSSCLVEGKVYFLNYKEKSIALGYGLDDRGSRVRLPAEAGNFSLHHRVQNGSGAHPAFYPMGTRGSFPGDKAAGAWSWPLTSI